MFFLFCLNGRTVNLLITVKLLFHTTKIKQKVTYIQIICYFWVSVFTDQTTCCKEKWLDKKPVSADCLSGFWPLGHASCSTRASFLESHWLDYRWARSQACSGSGTGWHTHSSNNIHLWQINDNKNIIHDYKYEHILRLDCYICQYRKVQSVYMNNFCNNFAA